MGKLVVTEFITLDGVVEAPGGEPTHPHTGWTMPYFGDDQGQFKFEETMAADVLLVGRVTYESFAGAWPGYEGEFAEKMNSMPKRVVSSTLTEPLEWNNAELLTGDPVEAVRALKDETDGTVIVQGSPTLAKALIAAGLVDELCLMVFPVVIGGGLRLFDDDRAIHHFRLVETVPFESGVVAYSYRPADPPETPAVEQDEQVERSG